MLFSGILFCLSFAFFLTKSFYEKKSLIEFIVSNESKSNKMVKVSIVGLISIAKAAIVAAIVFILVAGSAYFMIDRTIVESTPIDIISTNMNELAHWDFTIGTKADVVGQEKYVVSAAYNSTYQYINPGYRYLELNAKDVKFVYSDDKPQTVIYRRHVMQGDSFAWRSFFGDLGYKEDIVITVPTYTKFIPIQDIDPKYLPKKIEDEIVPEKRYDFD